VRVHHARSADTVERLHNLGLRNECLNALAEGFVWTCCELEHAFHWWLVGKRIGRVDQRFAREIVSASELDDPFGDEAAYRENDDVAEARGFCEGATVSPWCLGKPACTSARFGSRVPSITSCPCLRKPSARVCPTTPDPIIPTFMI